MVKTYLKTLVRTFKKHVTRLLSIILMVLVSVGFISGIGAASDKIDNALNEHYKVHNVSDVIVKSTRDTGFTDEEIKRVTDYFGENNVNTGASLDVRLSLTVNGEKREKELVRLYFFDDETRTVNIPETDEKGSYAGDLTKIAAAKKTTRMKGFSLGDEIELNFKEILTSLAEENDKEVPPMLSMLPDSMATRTVVVNEIQVSPIAFAVDGEPSYLNKDGVETDTIAGLQDYITLDNILYLPSTVIPVLMGNALIATSDLFVAFENRTAFQSFSQDYAKISGGETARLEMLLENENGKREFETISLYDNYSYHSLNAYSEKVRGLGYVLMVAFLLVTALVVQSTMTRLMDEERGQIACLRTLGYSAFRIIFKYVLFAMIATGIGGVSAFFAGVGVANLIYYVFNYSYVMPPQAGHVAELFFLIVFFIIVLVTLLATLLAGHKLTGDTCANLLRPKAPKAGKKVFLERIPLLWNRLSFKYKSTMRNVLRYMGRFLMTVIAVALSASLVMAGLSILDLCLFGGMDSPSIMLVAFVVIFFAGLLTAVVIYTITNINVSERNRELATLKVLGYYEGEVASYIYREIFIDTGIGILFGYPLAALLIGYVFKIIGLGTLGGISWFMWLIVPFVVLLFTGIVCLLLRRKIVKIDMNESLKAVE